MGTLLITRKDVLFCGKGIGIIPWYRTGQPAYFMGCDWVGLAGTPPDISMVAALKHDGMAQPDFSKYKIVVLQQAVGKTWANFIRELQRQGIVVLYEVDDYLHGVKKVKRHEARDVHDKKFLRGAEFCMGTCDGMIVSTDFLAERYRKFNKNIFVCKNGIDVRRYSHFRPPERDGEVVIGWAGGYGHRDAVEGWYLPVMEVMDRHPNVRFVSIGLPIADLFLPAFPGRALSIPSVFLENFPAALCNFDIAIAPAGRNHWYAAKSNLRFLETGAMRIPLVADPFIYGEIKHGSTGLLATSEDEIVKSLTTLVEQADYRRFLGNNAHAYVRDNYAVEVSIRQWTELFENLENRIH